MTCSESAALYIKQADKVFCTLAADTANTLVNAQGFTKEEEDNVDAAVFSKDGLTFNGTGTRKIQSEGNGMTSKDDLAVTGGIYEIASAGHGIEGKESIRIADGTFSITAGKDGIHAATVLQADGGSVTVTAGGGSAEADMDSKSQENGFGKGDWGMESTETEESDTASTKGLKAGQILRIFQGTYKVDTLDDAMHSNGDMEVTGGTFLLSSGDDAVHADGAVTIGGGTIEIPICYEGIEGKSILIQGGEISLTSADDGMNAASGEESVTVEMTELIYGGGSMEARGQRGFSGRKGDTMPQGGMERPDGRRERTFSLSGRSRS